VTFAFDMFRSPVGDLTMVASGGGLAALLWEDDDPLRVRVRRGVKTPDHPLLQKTSKQLRAYFSGKLTRFDLPLDFQGTDFQKQVWAALLRIPFGQVRSYGQVAADIGRPSASRAVGAANGRNPLSIIAPCHRVIGSAGALTGFAGGLEAKRYLLDHEQAVLRTGREWCTQEDSNLWPLPSEGNALSS
jgi:methylated-DNA-[protein]-cysteine S-methyltransferase